MAPWGSCLCCHFQLCSHSSPLFHFSKKRQQNKTFSLGHAFSSELLTRSWYEFRVYWKQPQSIGERAFQNHIPLFPCQKNDTQCYTCCCIYLVWLYIHCLQSVLPIQSRQSCILGRCPPGCLQTADLCVCNSSARCTPFPRPPASSRKHKWCI